MHACDFSEKEQKGPTNVKEGHNIWRFWQICTKLKNIFEKGSDYHTQ